jgi:hypothetical protein
MFLLFLKDLWNNQLQQIDKKLFNNLKEIIAIELGGNELDKIDQNTFKDLTKLKFIFLENNKFKTNHLILFIEKSVEHVSFKTCYFDNNINFIIKPSNLLNKIFE